MPRRRTRELALDVYLHRLRQLDRRHGRRPGRRWRCSCSPAGIGEHQPAIRARAVPGFLGAALDERRNQAAAADADISAAGSAVRTLVITSREDIEIARQVRALLG